MDRARIGKAAMGRPSSAVDSAMRRRMWVYAAGAVLVFVVWRLYRPPDDPLPTRATEPLGPVDTPAERLPPRAAIDQGRLAVVRDATPADRALLEEDAVTHLLEQANRLAYGDLDSLGLAPADWNALTTDSAAHRGAPVWALGTLQWIDTDMQDYLLRVRGELRDEQGRAWNFIVTTEPWELEVGDVVRISGFYLKNYSVLPPGSQDFVTAPLIIGKELLVSAFRIAPVTALRSDFFDDVRDGDLSQANRPLDSLEYYELLSYVTHAPFDSLFPAADPAPEVLPVELLRAPDRWRGQPVRVTGVLLYMKEAPLGPRGENPLGVPFVWQLWISDTRSGDAGTMLILCLEKPEGVSEGQIVDVDGVFFRRYAFENKRNRPRMVAAIPARRVTRFVPAPDTLTPILMRIIVGLVGGVALLLILGQMRERRSAGRARGSRMARRRRMILRDPPRVSSPSSAPASAPSGTATEQTPTAGSADEPDAPTAPPPTES